MDAEVTLRSEERLTQEQFFAWLQLPRNAHIRHCELIHGRIVMAPPADLIHANIGALLVARFVNYARLYGLGRVYDSSAGYDLPSGDTLEPDVSFISNERLATAPVVERGRFGRVVPDLVVEVASRSTARRDRVEKKAIYAANGVREYWLVDPDRRAITVFHLRQERFDTGRAFTTGAAASEILAGLEVGLKELFDF